MMLTCFIKFYFS